MELCILAGGKSRRMGCDKSRLKIGARTLIQHVSARAKATGLPVRIIRNDILPGCGPLGGLHTALEQSECDAVLVLASDMPFVPTWLIRELVEQSNHEAVFVSHDGRPGFPLLLPKSSLPIVRRNLDRKQFSLHELAKSLRAKIVNAAVEEHELANVNTPQEFREATKAWKVRHSRLRQLA